MSYVRADGYRLTNPEDDAAFQVVVGDLQRLALNLAKGSDSSAYMTENDVTETIDTSGFLTEANNFIRSGYTTLTIYYSGGTHTFAASSTSYAVMLIAGGGGGTGGGNAANTYASGNAGGGGETVYAFGKITAATATLTVGAAGTGGAAGYGLGTNGGTSTFDISGGLSITANYGARGPGTVNGGAGGHSIIGLDEIALGVIIRVPGTSGERSMNAPITIVAGVAAFGANLNSSGGYAAGSGVYGNGGNGGYPFGAGVAGTQGLAVVYEV